MRPAAPTIVAYTSLSVLIGSSVSRVPCRVISGRPMDAARARAILAQRLTVTKAYLTWDKEANEVEDAILLEVTQTTPIRPKTAPHEMPPPNTKAPPRAPTREATPTLPTQTKPDSKPPTVAGGGEAGGRGTDVVTVSTGGIDFPYPGYLENIVRQIATRFKPPSRGALRAEVVFFISRDGSVPSSSIRLVTRSGVYSFDVEAQGAVESAANARAFGPLPTGFTEDVLPVTFRFDPRLLR